MSYLAGNSNSNGPLNPVGDNIDIELRHRIQNNLIPNTADPATHLKLKRQPLNTNKTEGIQCEVRTIIDLALTALDCNDNSIFVTEIKKGPRSLIKWGEKNMNSNVNSFTVGSNKELVPNKSTDRNHEVKENSNSDAPTPNVVKNEDNESRPSRKRNHEIANTADPYQNQDWIDAELFDDCAIYPSNVAPEFFQIKHIADTSNHITLSNLTSMSGRFSLLKYGLSKYSKECNYFLLTNTKLHPTLRKKWRVEIPDNLSSTLKTYLKAHNAELYKFTVEIYEDGKKKSRKKKWRNQNHF